MTVTYKLIPGFPGYRVGDDGSVWTCWRQTGHQMAMTDTWKPKKITNTNTDPYSRVTLGRRGEKISFRVHVLILTVFVGPRPPRLDGCHNDGNRRNNNLSNLRWDTRANNHADKRRHGTDGRGERNAGCKLTEHQVLDIRRRYAKGERKFMLAKEFNVHPCNIHLIVKRINWKHI